MNDEKQQDIERKIELEILCLHVRSNTHLSDHLEILIWHCWQDKFTADTEHTLLYVLVFFLSHVCQVTQGITNEALISIKTNRLVQEIIVDGKI